ncbi:type II toxin-antitoxin system VapB family antitoxin [Pseudomonas putida]
MKKSSVIKTEHGQVVLLPEAVAFPDDVMLVDVVAIGRARIITPAGESWESWFDCAGADDLPERDQPTDQERSVL